MQFTVLFAGLPVADIDSGRAWYERLLGRPADLVPNANEVAWRITDAGWVYVVGDVDRAGRSLLTVIVDDLAEQVAALAGRGLVAGAIETMPQVGRRAAVTDPDGNRITFAELVPGDADRHPTGTPLR